MENQEKREMMIDAFPNESHNASCRGMTLRGYFANSAVQGFINVSNLNSSSKDSAELFAKRAYILADAMLKEREKE